MRDLTARLSFLIRKKLDNFLYWVFPRKWVPLYTSVTFTRMRYHHCISNKKWQDEVKKIQSAYNNESFLTICARVSFQIMSWPLYNFGNFLEFWNYFWIYTYCQNSLHFQQKMARWGKKIRSAYNNDLPNSHYMYVQGYLFKLSTGLCT